MKKKLYLNIFVFIIILISCTPAEYAYSASVKHQYFKAEREYRTLKKNRKKQKYRSNWIKTIKKFENAYKTDPGDAWAPAAMFYSGYLYFELSEVSYLKKDVKKGINRLEYLTKKYSSSRYKFKAIKAIKENKKKLYSSRYKPSSSSKPSHDPIKAVIEAKEPKVSKPLKTSLPKIIYSNHNDPKPDKTKYSDDNLISEIRFHTHKNRTRIVVDTKSEVKYQFNDLNKDRQNKKPARIYIDFKNIDLSKKVISSYDISDTQVNNVRIARYNKETVRLVLDLKKDAIDFKIFSLFKPYRTVIDVWGDSKKSMDDIKKHPVVSKNIAKSDKKPVPGSLVKQLALGVNKIVIDPGHGGKDFGAPGYLKGSHEKYVSLKIAKNLASKIKKELGYNVVLTRDSDKYLTLEQRTDVANLNKADLFISIHTNAARNKRAYGIETYFLNLATDEDSISVAARENATSTKNISDLQTILNDLMRDAKINESSRLATYIQDGIVNTLNKKYSYIKDRGVRQAPFYVLLGARMPAILIEVSFISNPRECKRLNSKAYQNRLCDGIMKGIKKYINETGARAIYRIDKKSNKKG